MINVVTPYGRGGPSSRVRVYEWLDRIPEPTVVSGYISHHNADPADLVRRPVALLAAEWRIRRMAADRPGRLLLHREASPLSRGGLERRLIERSEFSVYDFDDALQCDLGEGAWFRRLAPKAPKAEVAVRNADRVVAGNEFLADWAAGHNDDVVVIPSCVAPDEYAEKTDYTVKDPPRIGWVGSADNEVYLELIAAALWEVHRSTGARLTLIGTPTPRLGDLEEMIDRVAWSEATQHELLAELDIGIAPVPDEPYERGKCGYKILQYAAAGTPLVASPVGVNREMLSELNMPAPVGPEDWAEAMAGLLTMAPETREKDGRRAREIVQERYSYDSWLPRWRSAMELEG